VVIDEEDDGFVENGKKSGRKKPAYMGGLVLEPKKGAQLHHCLWWFRLLILVCARYNPGQGRNLI